MRSAHLAFMLVLATVPTWFRCYGQSAPGRETKISVATDAQVETPTKDSSSKPQAKRAGAIEIISDTQGVDFGAYLQKVVSELRAHGYKLVPVSAQREKGEVVIEFAIQKDGQVSIMKLAASSRNMSLDQPAWGGIAASSPFPKLPAAFTLPYLALRFHFSYNPDKVGLDVPSCTSGSALLAQDNSADSSEKIYSSGNEGVTPPRAVYSPNPEYTDRARRKKIRGNVVISLIVTPVGTVRDATVTTSLDKDLDKQALAAVSTWKFDPATKDGKPVAFRVPVEVSFKLY